jgi:hypothetical protein
VAGEMRRSGSSPRESQGERREARLSVRYLKGSSRGPVASRNAMIPCGRIACDSVAAIDAALQRM